MAKTKESKLNKVPGGSFIRDSKSGELIRKESTSRNPINAEEKTAKTKVS